MKTVILFVLGAALAHGSVGAEITFGEPDTFGAGNFPTAVALGDLTGDQQLDLVAVNRTSDDAWVWVGDGAGGFQFLQSFAVGNFPLDVLIANLDGNTNLDLATTAVPFNSGTVTAWSGDGDGTFGSSETLTADDGTRSVAAVLLDGNQTLDLVVANPTRGNISVFLGDGDGTFGAEIRTPVGGASSYPTSTAIADFDENGTLDVVTSNAQSVDDSLGIVFGNGDGTFGAATAIPTTCSRPEYVVTGDFDGDEHMDLAAVCFFSSDVAVFLGDGSGGFASPVLYSLLPDGPDPNWIVADDFDNDGVDDLVTAGNGNFSVLRGRGDGTFEPPVARVVVGNLFGSAAADLDGDGFLDLVFSNGGLDEIWVFLNGSAAAPVPALGAAGVWLLVALLLASTAVLVRRIA